MEKTDRPRKSGPSEFLIKIQRRGGLFAGGEVTSVFLNETWRFCDIHEMIKIIERQCDAAAYPQAQRKLRSWNSK